MRMWVLRAVRGFHLHPKILNIVAQILKIAALDGLFFSQALFVNREHTHGSYVEEEMGYRCNVRVKFIITEIAGYKLQHVN